ncbi:MAG TPA: hypothetical protein VI259_12150, partial [Gemmatimonadaceae bacterium]
MAELLAELGVEPGSDPFSTAQQLLDKAETVGHTVPGENSAGIPALPASGHAEPEVFSPGPDLRPALKEPASARLTQVSETVPPGGDSLRTKGSNDDQGGEPGLAFVSDAETDDKLAFAVARAEELENTLAERAEELAELKEVASELAKSYENARDRVDDLEKALTDREAELTAAATRVEDLERKIAAEESTHRASDERASELATRLNDSESCIAQLEQS